MTKSKLLWLDKKNLNTWLPNQHENPNKSGTIIGRKVDITVISKTADILENTYLTTIQIWMYLVLQGKEWDEQDRLVGGGHHPQQAITSVKETAMEYEKKELAIWVHPYKRYYTVKMSQQLRCSNFYQENLKDLFVDFSYCEPSEEFKNFSGE